MELAYGKTLCRKDVEENKPLNLASAPRSTEIIPSHKHATTNMIKENDGTMVPNSEENMADGQYERSVKDALTFGIEPITIDEEVRNSV